MAANFSRFLTIEEASKLLGVSPERISMWIGECKMPVAARSEYAGFLLRTRIVETVGRNLADALPPEARLAPAFEARGYAGIEPDASPAGVFAATGRRSPRLLGASRTTIQNQPRGRT
jgi:hypothetical protein